MKLVKFIPECFNGEGKLFEGELVLVKPSIDDLFEGSSVAKSAAGDDVKATKDFVLWSKKFYNSVKVKNLADDSEYNSFDDLMSDAESLPILQEVAIALVSGLNKKKMILGTVI